MIQHALPVPPGFCVTATVWREHLAANHLTEQLDRVLHDVARAGSEATRRRLAAWRQAIIDARIPDAVQEEIGAQFRVLNADFVAVRSSASAEDLPGHSFAGQHDTFLGIGGLSECLDAVKKCWASLWTTRAFEYRARNGVEHAGADMAVIIQRLIPADASGVIFTVDPLTGRRDRIVIESTFGLGEPLVAGKVTPDRTVLSRPGLEVVASHTADKTTASVLRPPHGIVERTVPPDRVGEPSLDDGVPVRLGRLALEAEQVFGCPLDIEFALAGGEPYLLQARPVTAVPAPPESLEDRQVWTNANTGEVLPDVVTPMTWSIVEPLVIRLFGQLFGKLGMDVGDHPLIALVAGRAYFNLNTMIACVRHVPGMGEQGMTEVFGGRQDVAARLGQLHIAEEDIPDLGFSRLGIALRIPGLVYRFLTVSRRRGNAVIDRVRRQTDAIAVAGAQASSVAELASRTQAIIARLMGDMEIFDLAGLAPTYGTALYSVCRTWFGDRGSAVASRLLMGLGNNDSANAGLRLWRLARLAHSDRAVESAVLQEDDFQRVRQTLAGTAAAVEFLQAWDAFMEAHGHHCRGELEFMNARWSETPDYILSQLKGYVRAVGPDDFLARYNRLARTRLQVAAQARRELRHPLKRLLFELLLKRAQACAAIRECLKSQLVRRLAVTRKWLLELGNRLTEAGLLTCRDDIFFLRLEEIGGVSLGQADRSAVAGRIAARRAEYRTNLSVTPPPVVVGRFDPAIDAQETVETSGDTLTGVAVNPGLVTGRARVILRAGADTVRPGEILVAPFTDPGWTPYFLNAAAIVMDTGGILSHGSIIAREYGIPAVVNVGSATAIIRTGQIIQVDGNRGTVRILSTGSPASGDPPERPAADRP